MVRVCCAQWSLFLTLGCYLRVVHPGVTFLTFLISNVPIPRVYPQVRALVRIVDNLLSRPQLGAPLRMGINDISVPGKDTGGERRMRQPPARACLFSSFGWE